MRTLLTDDDRLAELRAEIAARADESWDDYAREPVGRPRPAPDGGARWSVTSSASACGRSSERSTPIGRRPARRRRSILRVAQCLGEPRDDHAWLTLAVITASLPERQAVIDLRREIGLDGPESALRALVASARRRIALRAWAAPTVRVAQGAVVVGRAPHRSHQTRDRHPACRPHDPAAVDPRSRCAARRVDVGTRRAPGPLATASGGTRSRRRPGSREGQVRPARSSCPGGRPTCCRSSPSKSERTSRILALAEFSDNATAAIGFDCVPLTSAETVGIGMGGAFGKTLAAVARFDRVATISEAAANEYRGWAHDARRSEPRRAPSRGRRAAVRCRRGR